MWNDAVEAHVARCLASKGGYKRLYGKTWAKLRDFHEQKLQKLPNSKPQAEKALVDSEGFQAARSTTQVHSSHGSPTKPCDMSKPSPVPPSFPRVAVQYQQSAPGTQISCMPALAVPHIADNKLAPYAPYNTKNSESLAQTKRANPEAWINRKLVCSKCNFPYGKYSSRHMHLFMGKGFALLKEKRSSHLMLMKTPNTILGLLQSASTKLSDQQHLEHLSTFVKKFVKYQSLVTNSSR